MSQEQKQGQPPAPPPITPYLTVANARSIIEVYQKGLGAQVVSTQPAADGKRLMHAALLINGGMLMLSDDFPEFHGGKSSTPKAFGGTAVTIHLDLPDVDATWTQAVAAGFTVLMPLADQFWGDRYGQLEDPEGHRWSLATRKRQPTQAELDRGAKEATKQA
jgi:PhnB protein